MRVVTTFIIFFSALTLSAQQPCVPGSSPLQIGGNTGTGSISAGTCGNAALGFKSNDTIRLIIQPNGRFSFGQKKIASNHPHANAPFQFDGKIACKELVVVDPAKWADFVFADNYTVMTLSELERYYRTFKHLPGVPSADQVRSDGLNVAEVNAILLQKIEELTLYVVELNKRIDELQTERKATDVR